jgi:oligoribonuclease
MTTLIFADTETTGLEPKSGQLLLEVGLLAVSEPDFAEIDAWSTPIQWLPEQLDAALAGNDFVRRMHTENGLLAELGASPMKLREQGGLPSLGQAQIEAKAFVNRHSKNAQIDAYGRPEIVLCGANPEFDRKWLAVFMPDLAAKFHYRNFDINSLWLLKRWLLGGEAVKFGQKHRVLADCREAVATVHKFVEAFGEPFMQQIAELEKQLAAYRQGN